MLKHLIVVGESLTLVLGGIAAILFVAIVATIVQQSRTDEVLGTAPTSLSPSIAGSVDIAPASVAPETLSDVLATKQQAASSAQRRLASLDEFLPGNLGVGTTLTHQGKVSTIVGVFSFDFDGELWQDYLAEDRGGEWWRFGVEPDRGFRLAAFQPHPIPLEPGPPTINFQGASYLVTESGMANYRAAGRTSTFETGRYWYYDYENTEGTILSFERFDHDTWKTSIGHWVAPHDVTVENELAAVEPGTHSELNTTIRPAGEPPVNNKATLLTTHVRRGR